MVTLEVITARGVGLEQYQRCFKLGQNMLVDVPHESSAPLVIGCAFLLKVIIA